MKNCCKKGIFLSLSAALLLSGAALQFSSGFSLSKIVIDLPKEPSKSSNSFEISGPYRYLSHERKSFALESADRKSVIKFFNQKYFRPRWYRVFLRSKKARRKYDKKISLRKKFYETSYFLAMKEMQKETGIIYIHLSNTQASLPTVELIDSSGRTILVDLNQTAFVIQKKATPYLSYMEEISQKEGTDGLKKEIDRWLSFSSRRIEKGIFDKDHDIWSNTGVLDGEVVCIDPGRYYVEENKTDPALLELEWWKATHRLYKWLLTNNLNAASYLYQKTTDLCHLQPPIE